jgi:hypothetical protein
VLAAPRLNSMAPLGLFRKLQLNAACQASR